MTREEAIEIVKTAFSVWELEFRRAPNDDWSEEHEALDMAIEALKAQDRPIICPRCGRTFSEAEGRERDK